MAEVMAKMLASKANRSKEAAQEIAVRYAADTMVYWANEPQA